MTTANPNGNGGDDAPKTPPRMVNPYVSVDNPEEPQLCGFGMSYLMALSAMVNEYQIMPQQMIDALMPSPEERAVILRQKAAAMIEAAEKLENPADGSKPEWGSKWKN